MKISLTVSIVVMVSVLLSNAQTVSWRCTTQPAPWVDNGTLPTSTNPFDKADSALYISVDLSAKRQVIEGWGGAVNELGWDALSALSQPSRDSVLKAIFDSSECAINNVRIPIGANDFSPGYYSCAETPGDYQMNSFTIAREKLRLIPYLKGALATRPDLKVWGSPWSPPAWMKTNNDIAARDNTTGGRLKQDPPILAAYALYFEKWVKAMQAEGIPLFAVHVQNEPNIGNNYPSCLMSGAEMRTFIRDYLGPRFKSNAVNSEIWLGTIQNNDFDARIKAVLDDKPANAFVTGVGLQWTGLLVVAKTLAAYPTKKIWQTEMICGNFFWRPGYDSFVAPNDWKYGTYTFNHMSMWLKSGINGHCQWNMVLDSSGKSWDNWPQNSMVTVFKGSKKVRYNPQYYVVKHFSRFVKPGAHLVEAVGNFGNGATTNLGEQYDFVPNGDKLAFLNPDGSTVVVVRNSLPSARPVAVKVGATKFKPVLPANSICTFVVTAPVAVRVYPSVRQAASFRQSRSGIFFSIPKTQTASLLKLEIVDVRGRTVAVPMAQMSTGGDYFVRCNLSSGTGLYFARLHFNGIAKTERLVFQGGRSEL